MSIDIFLGGLASLILAAVIIYMMTNSRPENVRKDRQKPDAQGKSDW